MRMFKRLKRTLRYSNSAEYPRRYAVMNAFDGLITILGIILGSKLLGSAEAGQIVAASVGALIAMGISGASGTYMTEMAEQERKIKELQDAMLTNLEGTVLVKAHREAAVVSALVDSAAAIFAGLLAVAPYFLTVAGYLSEVAAFYSSLIISLSLLFTLGVFLGKVAGRSLLFSGLKALGIGCITLLFLLLLNLVL
ncbi:MAG: hypothetical protein B6U65_00105 [Candidatus Wolframiiraptor sp. EX4484-121]|nr:MAG: hypothetical protein B6U65_00105 [Candidatus Wolframiiraptor sp. EX4484-121]